VRYEVEWFGWFKRFRGTKGLHVSPLLNPGNTTTSVYDSWALLEPLTREFGALRNGYRHWEGTSTKFHGRGHFREQGLRRRRHLRALSCPTALARSRKRDSRRSLGRRVSGNLNRRAARVGRRAAGFATATARRGREGEKERGLALNQRHNPVDCSTVWGTGRPNRSNLHCQGGMVLHHTVERTVLDVG